MPTNQPAQENGLYEAFAQPKTRENYLLPFSNGPNETQATDDSGSPPGFSDLPKALKEE